MMASNQGPKGSAQKKAMTYGAPKRRLISTQSSPVDSSLYDFPDTESSGSPPTPKKPTVSSKSKASLPKRPSLKNGEGSVSRNPSLTPARKTDDDRKRSHATAFSAESRPKKSVTSLRTASATSAPSPKAEMRKPELAKDIPKAALPTTKGRIPEPSASNRPRVVPKMIPKDAASRSPPPLIKATSEPQSPINYFGSQPPPQRRKRLIDALSAQRAKTPDSDPDAPSSSDDDNLERAIMPGTQTPLSQKSAAEVEMRAAHTSNPIRTPASKKIKHTYSQARSIRSDTQLSSDPYGIGPDPLAQSLLPSPPSKPSGDPFDLPDDDLDLDEDDNEPKLRIKSAHELRRAGANSRFTDEMEDLLSRIGTPGAPTSSMRRNALLELSQKLQREEFAVQFRDHADRDTVAKGIGKEDDLISGFALSSSLIMFLSSKQAPNLLQHLAEERIGKLLGRMLHFSDDIDAIASQRATNLSKMSRKTVSDVKSSLSRMPIWYDRQPAALSPRTVALQLINIIHRYLEPRHREKLLADVEAELDVIVEQQVTEGSEDQVEFALSASILECESGITTPTGQAWVLKHAPHTAQLLQKTLKKRSKPRDEVDKAILKVAINTTNTKFGAESFSKPSLLSGLTAWICDDLRQVQGAVEQGKFEEATHEELIMVLGVTINVLEHCPPARASMSSLDLQKLTAIFFDSHRTVNDADSEEKSKVSVALGYLAIILGYLSLNQQARSLIAERTHGAGLRELIDSIRQFIGIYRNVESNMQELEGLVNELQRHGK